MDPTRGVARPRGGDYRLSLKADTLTHLQTRDGVVVETQRRRGFAICEAPARGPSGRIYNYIFIRMRVLSSKWNVCSVYAKSRQHHAISFGDLLPVALVTEPTGCLIRR